MKKILILGGSKFQVPLIVLAKSLGSRVITCDNLPSNPGHSLADAYFEVSTTDLTGVLNLARQEKIEAIATFASDPSTRAVGFVCDALGLPGPSFAAVQTMTEKHLFRAAVQGLGLPTPRHFTFKPEQFAHAALPSGTDWMIKPVDSSGSKGVSRLQGGFTAQALQLCFNKALVYSGAKQCIAEEWIEGQQLHGDGFMQDGHLVNHYLGRQSFCTRHGGFGIWRTDWPSQQSESVLDEVARQVALIARHCGYRDGAMNIEARVTPQGQVYILEMGPRAGGNFIPVMHEHLTGLDTVWATLQIALGQRVAATPYLGLDVATVWTAHSHESGRFDRLRVHPDLVPHCFFKKEFISPDDLVRPHVSFETAVATCLFQFDSVAQQEYWLAQDEQAVKVILS
jgi:biotin carboxylase